MRADERRERLEGGDGASPWGPAAPPTTAPDSRKAATNSPLTLTLVLLHFSICEVSLKCKYRVPSAGALLS